MSAYPAGARDAQAAQLFSWVGVAVVIAEDRADMDAVLLGDAVVRRGGAGARTPSPPMSAGQHGARFGEVRPAERLDGRAEAGPSTPAGPRGSHPYKTCCRTAAHTALVTTPSPAVIWPSLSYRDAAAAVRFLVDAFGFTTTIVVPGQEVGDEDRAIAHAELRSPLGGCIMLQSATDGEESNLQPTPGSSYTYVVTDEPDLLFTRATQAGAEVLHGLYDARL